MDTCPEKSKNQKKSYERNCELLPVGRFSKRLNLILVLKSGIKQGWQAEKPSAILIWALW